MRQEQRAQGIPPHWMLYISVDNADQSAAKAAQAGGTVLAPAFDVMDFGRMAIIQDPTGVIFSLWQAKREGHGMTTAGDNTFCWADLSTPDPERASKFYAELFGWSMIKDEKDSSGYIHIKNGENFIGGIPPAAHRNPNAPPHWLIYFQVASPENAIAKTTQLGGKILMPARQMENVGTWSIVADPQGAVFALFKSAR
jgi:predicted enzyme related to lactoylglutathione lyase